MVKSIKVDAAKCIHCGMCVKDCIVNCLQFNAEKIPGYIDGGEKICVGCQHCMAICPKGALSFGGKNPDDSEPVNNWDSAALLNLMKSRRSFRSYKNQDVPKEKLDKLIEMLAYPPTGGNVDTLHFSIISSVEKMRALSKLTYEKIAAMQNPSPTMKFLLDKYNAGEDFIYRDAAALAAVSVNLSKAIAGCENADPIIALTYLELYAQSLGLGTLWCDAALTVAQNISEVKNFLEIPQDYTLNYTLLLGVPAIKYKRTVQRDAANVTIL